MRRPLAQRLAFLATKDGYSWVDSHVTSAGDGWNALPFGLKYAFIVEHTETLRKSRYLFTLEDRPFGMAIPLLGSEGFSFDLTEGIYSGYPVAYFALQIAVFMGFKQVFYVGLDLQHCNGRTHFFGRDPVSDNHEQTEFPKMIRMLNSAALRLASSDVHVFNCSPSTTLDGFQHVSLDWAIKQ